MCGMDPSAWKAAIRAENIEVVRAHLDADPEATGGYLPVERDWGEELWLPLHLAAEVGGAGGRAAVELLLERGAKPDSRTRFRTPMHARQTALHLAAARADAAMCETLLDAGADIDALDARLDSPMHHLLLGAAAGESAAAFDAVTTAYQALLERGAELGLRNAEGRPPWHSFVAALVDHQALSEQMNDARLQGGAGVGNTGEVKSQIYLCADLIETCVDLHEDGKSLMNLELICPREPQGWTLLHRVVALGDAGAPLAVTLVQQGVENDAAPPEGLSAVQLAEARGCEALLEVMRS